MNALNHATAGTAESRGPVHAARQAPGASVRPGPRPMEAAGDVFASLLQELAAQELATPAEGADAGDTPASSDGAPGLPPPFAELAPPGLLPAGLAAGREATAPEGARGAHGQAVATLALAGAGTGAGAQVAATASAGRSEAAAAPAEAARAEQANLPGASERPAKAARALEMAARGPREAFTLPQAPANEGAASALPQASAPASAAAVAQASPGAAPELRLPPALPADAFATALRDAAPVDAPMLPTLQARPGEAAFGGELSARVQLMLEGGVTQAELRLDPAELGPIRIELALEGQTAEIRFDVANDATREGVRESLSELREMLAEQGLSLGQTHVGGGQAQAQERTPQPAGGRDIAARMATGEAAATPQSASPRAPRGLLDLYA